MKEIKTCIIIIFIGLIVPIISVVKSIQFDQDCGGFLKQTADANTVELAIDRISTAIDYIEKNNLTNGYTSVLWRTENENIGYWYDNVKACKQELEACVDGTQLEKSNVLMKVRESLTDNGEKGTELTIPTGISRYPSNLIFGILNWISLILVCFGVIRFLYVTRWY